MMVFNMTGRNIPGTMSFQSEVHINALLREDMPRDRLAEVKVRNLTTLACYDLRGMRDKCAIIVDKGSALVDLLKDSLEDENFEVIYA